MGFPELLDTGDHETTSLFFLMILGKHQQGIYGKNRLRTKFAGYNVHLVQKIRTGISN